MPWIIGIFILSIIVCAKGSNNSQPTPDAQPAVASIAQTTQPISAAAVPTSEVKPPEPATIEQPQPTTELDRLIAEHIDQTLIGELVEVNTKVGLKGFTPATYTVDSYRDLAVSVMVAKDESATKTLIEQGKLIFLAPHTYALVLDASGLLYQIHIQSGEYIGQDVWVSSLANPLHRIIDKNNENKTVSNE